MIKYFSILALMLPTLAQGFHIYAPAAHIDLNTNKVSYIVGEVSNDMAATYVLGVNATSTIPGARIIIFNSLGGYVESGETIIQAMEAEKAKGVKLVCAVNGEATSMAFNILTHCDVRLATRTSQFLVHKAAVWQVNQDRRWTAKNLRWLANYLEREDEPFRQANAKAMGLSLAEYDDAADEERTWYALKLRSMGYLHGIIKFNDN